MEREKRGANFTKAEIDLLIDITLKYQDIVENKSSDAKIWKDKDKAWQEICNEFNTAPEIFPRAAKAIRIKYDTMKKNIRKKLLFKKAQKSGQTKIGAGQYEALTSSEKKLLSILKSTVGYKSISEARFDNDSEVGASNFTRWTTQQDIEEKDAERNVINKDIEFIDDEDDESESTEEKTEEKVIKRDIDAVDSINEDNTQKERAKASENSQTGQTIAQLENEILVLQRNLLLQETEAKLEVTKLTIENLKLDAQIKKLTLQKLEANIVDN